MVDQRWLEEFEERLAEFERSLGQRGGHVVSINVRVDAGCFHREHSQKAYEIIDVQRRNLPDAVEFLEHETGPELLVYLALEPPALGLLKCVVELVTKIIKARSVGIQKGDNPRQPLSLIVRRVDPKKEYREELVLRIDYGENLSEAVIAKKLNDMIREMFEDDK